MNERNSFRIKERKERGRKTMIQREGLTFCHAGSRSMADSTWKCEKEIRTYMVMTAFRNIAPRSIVKVN
jgi:hypothetical protein